MEALFLLAAFAIAPPIAMAQMPPQTIRVGTFHKPSVVVAFYRSPMWAEQIKEKMAEREAAKRANDTKKVQELEAWGGKQQELAHQQLTGEASIANILDSLAVAMPEIGRKAQVAAIAVDLTFASSLVETVDVTEQILDWLKADEATRKIARELRSRPARED